MKNQNDSKNINDNDVISFSMMDFFDRFVRSANEKGLLRTPLPTPLSRALIRTSSIQLLQAARLDPQDVTLHEDNYGGTITLTSFGLQHIVQFLNFKQQSKAATNIQKVWRGYVTRKKVAYMFANHNDIDPKKQVLYLEQYISGISVLYHTILNAQRPTNANQAPTGSELDFMRKLSHPETYRVCQEYLTLLAQVEASPKSPNNRMTLLPGSIELQNTMLMYTEYAPLVLIWISKILKIQFKPNQDLLYILRSGDILCRIACSLYQRVECQLLDKGLEYGIHKIIFFLELCKSLHLKRSLLFQVSDLLVWPDNDPHRKSALIVLRTIIALEKHARKSGWDGPTIDLKPIASLNLGVTSRESMLRNTSTNSASSSPKGLRKAGSRPSKLSLLPEIAENVPDQQHPNIPQRSETPPQRMATPPQSNMAPPQRFNTPPNGPPQRYNTPPQHQEGPPQRYNTPPQHQEGPPQRFNTPPQRMDTPPQRFNTPPMNNGRPFSNPYQNSPPSNRPTSDQYQNSPPPIRSVSDPYQNSPPSNRPPSDQYQNSPPSKRQPNQYQGNAGPGKPNTYQNNSSPINRYSNENQTITPPVRRSSKDYQYNSPPMRRPSNEFPNGQPPIRSSSNEYLRNSEQNKGPYKGSAPQTSQYQESATPQHQQQKNADYQRPNSNSSQNDRDSYIDRQRPLSERSFAGFENRSFGGDSNNSPTPDNHMYSDTSSDEGDGGNRPYSPASQASEMSKLMNESLRLTESLERPLQSREDTPDPKMVLEEAILSRIAKRTTEIDNLVFEEQTYTDNLSNVADYLSTLMKQRRRRSNLLPPISDEDRKTIPLPNNFSFSGSSLQQLPNESERAYKFRLDTEIEEITRILTVLQGMVAIHTEFIESLKNSWNKELQTFVIGRPLANFTAKLQRPYTTYAVVALSGTDKSFLTLTSRGEVERSEFVNRVVNKYVTGTLSGDSNVEEPSAQDWHWYLTRPIHRLSVYPQLLSAIHGESKIRLRNEIDMDNRKLRISSIKFGCISAAIKEHFDSVNKRSSQNQ